jgi:hypothetical protein
VRTTAVKLDSGKRSQYRSIHRKHKQSALGATRYCHCRTFEPEPYVSYSMSTTWIRLHGIDESNTIDTVVCPHISIAMLYAANGVTALVAESRSERMAFAKG